MAKKFTRKTPSKTKTNTEPEMKKGLPPSTKVLLFVLIPIVFWFVNLALLLTVGEFFVHPRVQRFARVHSLQSWDMRSHLYYKTDIDGDTVNDMITFTGCAFLSSVTPESIPAEKHCTAEGIAVMSGFTNETIGQKFTSNPATNLDLRQDKTITYAYAAQSFDGNWSITVKENNQPLRTFDINTSGMLAEREPSLTAKLDASLYSMTSVFTYIVFLPVWLIAVIFNPSFGP